MVSFVPIHWAASASSGVRQQNGQVNFDLPLGNADLQAAVSAAQVNEWGSGLMNGGKRGDDVAWMGPGRVTWTRPCFASTTIKPAG